MALVYQQVYKKFDFYKYVKENFLQKKIIKLKEDTGFIKGSNVKIKEIFKDEETISIVCFNNDIRNYKNWLRELMRKLGQ